MVKWLTSRPVRIPRRRRVKDQSRVVSKRPSLKMFQNKISPFIQGSQVNFHYWRLDIISSDKEKQILILVQIPLFLWQLKYRLNVKILEDFVSDIQFRCIIYNNYKKYSVSKLSLSGFLIGMGSIYYRSSIMYRDKW